MEEVILVDEKDNQIGTEEKLKAHKDGKLHRCFSIFVFNENNELLIQQRAMQKYHCGGIWANTCCSHPRPNEILKRAVHRRLKEELGFDCDLKEVFSFIYKAKFNNGLTEHEFDHVFKGKVNSKDIVINPNKNEVMNFRWISLNKLKKEFINFPNKYAIWFKIAIKKFLTN